LVKHHIELNHGNFPRQRSSYQLELFEIAAKAH